MRAKTYYLHVNKKTQSWTIHGSGQCIKADKVLILADCETIYKPLKKDNPRFFIKVVGHLTEIIPGYFKITKSAKAGEKSK